MLFVLLSLNDHIFEFSFVLSGIIKYVLFLEKKWHFFLFVCVVKFKLSKFTEFLCGISEFALVSEKNGIFFIHLC